MCHAQPNVHRSSPRAWPAAGLDERDQMVLEYTIRQGLEGDDLAAALGSTRSRAATSCTACASAPNEWAWSVPAADTLGNVGTATGSIAINPNNC